MNDTLGMNHDLDMIRMRTEQPVRLDHLQTFIHHGRRVHGNFATHAPVRMCNRLLGRNLIERGNIAVKEGPTGRSQENLAYAMCLRCTLITERQALENRVVFTIDRQQRCATGSHCIHEQGARHDQRLFISQ